MDGTASSNVWRSIAAVFAGLVVSVLLSIGTDVLLHTTGVFPATGKPMSDGLFLLATAYRTVYSIFGCYLAARLAASKPMRHAWILGAIGLILSLIGLLKTWNRGPEFGPKWYPIALIVLALPSAWVGGKFGSRLHREQAAV
jgi:hypothetical protein